MSHAAKPKSLSNEGGPHKRINANQKRAVARSSMSRILANSCSLPSPLCHKMTQFEGLARCRPLTLDFPQIHCDKRYSHILYSS